MIDDDVSTSTFDFSQSAGAESIISDINQLDGADTSSEISENSDQAVNISNISDGSIDNSEDDKESESDDDNESKTDDDSESENDDDSESEYDTEDEVDSEPIRAVLVPSADNPGDFEVDTSETIEAPSSLPLCLSLNARSV